MFWIHSHKNANEINLKKNIDTHKKKSIPLRTEHTHSLCIKFDFAFNCMRQTKIAFSYAFKIHFSFILKFLIWFNSLTTTYLIRSRIFDHDVFITTLLIFKSNKFKKKKKLSAHHHNSFYRMQSFDWLKNNFKHFLF